MLRYLMVLCLLLVVAPFATAQDPTEVDSDHYKVLFDNDYVRAVRITYGPGDKSVMHYHPDGVAVFFTDQKVQFKMPDDTTQVVEAKAGEATWIPAGHHNPENLTDEGLDLVLVELKGGDVMAAAPSAAKDPTEVDPDHYETVFENDQVRAVRITYGPNEKSVMHYHPDNVAVFFVDQTAKFTMPDGSTQTEEAKAREAIFAPAGDHLPENLGDGPIDLILVELKGSKGGD